MHPLADNAVPNLTFTSFHWCFYEILRIFKVKPIL